MALCLFVALLHGKLSLAQLESFTIGNKSQKQRICDASKKISLQPIPFVMSFQKWNSVYCSEVTKTNQLLQTKIDSTESTTPLLERLIHSAESTNVLLQFQINTAAIYQYVSRLYLP